MTTTLANPFALDLSDIDQQRILWRIAALRLGMDEGHARGALLRQIIADIPWWMLVTFGCHPPYEAQLVEMRISAPCCVRWKTPGVPYESAVEFKHDLPDEFKPLLTSQQASEALRHFVWSDPAEGFTGLEWATLRGLAKEGLLVLPTAPRPADFQPVSIAVGRPVSEILLSDREIE